MIANADEDVRLHAIYALAKIADPRAVDPMRLLLDDTTKASEMPPPVH